MTPDSPLVAQLKKQAKNVTDHLGYVFAAIGAALLAVAALIYGKKTLSVLSAQIAAHNAKGRLINGQIANAEAKAEAEKNDNLRNVHVARAQSLRSAAAVIEDRRLRLIQESGDLPEVSDVDVARAHNRAR